MFVTFNNLKFCFFVAFEFSPSTAQGEWKKHIVHPEQVARDRPSKD